MASFNIRDFIKIPAHGSGTTTNSKGRELFPEGTYKFVINDLKMWQSKKWILELKVTDGPRIGEETTQWISWNSGNETADRVGHEQMAYILFACGHESADEEDLPSLLVDKQFIGRIVHRNGFQNLVDIKSPTTPASKPKAPARASEEDLPF